VGRRPPRCNPLELVFVQPGAVADRAEADALCWDALGVARRELRELEVKVGRAVKEIERPKGKTQRRGPGPVQRQRSEEKRERVIRAAIECIAEEGLQQATAGRIVERSGISWGGIQHQFGDKTGILDAVLDQLLRDLRDQVEQFSTRATSIEGRVRALVDAAWNLLRDPTYQAFREVMRGHTPSAGVRLDSEALLQQVGLSLLELCGELFPERRGSHKTLSLVGVILFATLSGMAEQQQYAVLEDSLTSRQLAILRETLERVIGGEARA